MTHLGVESGARRKSRDVAAASRSPEANGSNRGAVGIADAVANALYWDFALPRHRINARCDDGWITLTGEVQRAYQRSSAEADVMRVRGVRGVTNAIKVEAAAPGNATIASAPERHV